MSRQTLQGGTVFAGYSIVRELGQGGMATVYLADDPKHHRQVALKVLKLELAVSIEAARFLREIEIAATLTHPNILPLHDSGNDNGRLYYVMPYVEGGSLRERLGRERQLSVQDAVCLTREVADALVYAQERGVVHRDIKPENILLQHGHAVLVDFGVARAFSMLERTFSTGAGMTVGTPEYMSPEQATGELTIDYRADQYALACVLYEMLAGHPPFSGRDIRATLARQVTDTPPPLATVRPGIPGQVRQTVMRGLAKTPADRFPSAREFAEALVAPTVDAEPASSIAVLPFVNLSGDSEDQYFGEGMAEEIITALAKIQGLHVASRTSAFAFKDKHLDIRAIGELLNVGAVLEGSVRRSGNTLRVTAQLISTTDGYHLWAGRFDRERKDIFAIHDDIAANIVRALRMVLGDDARRHITRAPTSDPEAYDLYLRGRQFFHQHRKKSMVFARQMFQRAIQVDPEYARAYAGIADVGAFLAHYYKDDNEAANLEEADAASQKALELDPELAEAHAARGFLLSLKGRDAEAEQEFERAIALEPHQFEALYFHARTCFARGELTRALELFREAAHVRDDPEALYFAGQTLTALGRTADAEEEYRKALPVIERYLELNPDDARVITLAAVCCSRLGQRARGLAWAEQATVVDPEDANVAYNVACLMALEGERSRAFDLLEQAFRVGFAHRDWIENDPDLATLRGDPRFQALLAEK